jgi:hypothetical protein
MEYGVIEALEQGGKTDTARGQRKVLYLRIETAGADILQNVPTLEASIASLSLMKVEELQ